jgi:hypothetical protein
LLRVNLWGGAGLARKAHRIDVDGTSEASIANSEKLVARAFASALRASETKPASLRRNPIRELTKFRFARPKHEISKHHASCWEAQQLLLEGGAHVCDRQIELVTLHSRTPKSGTFKPRV